MHFIYYKTKVGIIQRMEVHNHIDPGSIQDLQSPSKWPRLSGAQILQVSRCPRVLDFEGLGVK